MPAMTTIIDLNWEGPYDWVGEADETVFTTAAAARHGVYLFTCERPNGYLVYAAGLTTRPFRTRFWEHTTAYLAGLYNVLDAERLRQGERHVLWNGLWYRRNAAGRLPELLARGGQHWKDVEDLLRTFKVFLGPLEQPRRVLERIEAGIMSCLYNGPPEFAGIPDRGMHLCARRTDEPAIAVRSGSSAALLGIPEYLDV